MENISNQVKQIEEYVRFGETLPTQISAVKVYLGYDTSDVPELEPVMMQALFTKIRNHIDLWKKGSSQAKNQLRELSITASDVIRGGKGLMKGLEALGPVAQILNTIGEASISESDFDGENIDLDAATLARLNRLQPYIDSLHATSIESVGDTESTNKMIADFRDESSILEANVSGKVIKLKDHNGSTIGKEKTIEPMIDAYKEACARIVQKFGEKSEAAIAIQKQIQITLSELKSRQSDLQDQQRLTYAIGRLFVHLQSLGYAMLDAQSTLTHLWLKGSTTCARLNNITNDLGSITSEETLLNFYISYKKVLKDWSVIEEDAVTLYKAL